MIRLLMVSLSVRFLSSISISLCAYVCSSVLLCTAYDGIRTEMQDGYLIL